MVLRIIYRCISDPRRSAQNVDLKCKYDSRSSVTLPFSFVQDYNHSRLDSLLGHSQNQSLHQATKGHSQTNIEVQVAQEACSSKPYTQTIKVSQRNLPPSQDDAPPPIVKDKL